jgi:hypothetical protein
VIAGSLPFVLLEHPVLKYSLEQALCPVVYVASRSHEVRSALNTVLIETLVPEARAGETEMVTEHIEQRRTAVRGDTDRSSAYGEGDGSHRVFRRLRA